MVLGARLLVPAFSRGDLSYRFCDQDSIFSSSLLLFIGYSTRRRFFGVYRLFRDKFFGIQRKTHLRYCAYAWGLFLSLLACGFFDGWFLFRWALSFCCLFISLIFWILRWCIRLVRILSGIDFILMKKVRYFRGLLKGSCF